MYSFSKAERFAVTGDTITAPKNTPGPQYVMPEVTKYKFDNSQKWRIGTAKRKPPNNNEKYAYFNHVYNEKEDLSKYPKKFNRTLGGAIGTAARIKYDFREKTPGPGRYNPSLKCTRPKTAQYFIAEKTGNSALNIMTGTNKDVGPGKYRPESAIYYSHHPKFPKYSIGKAERPPLNPSSLTKNAGYGKFVYSSIGKQVQSKKKSEEEVIIGTSTREREKKRGMFTSMMERRPMSIKIAMPKF